MYTQKRCPVTTSVRLEHNKHFALVIDFFHSDTFIRSETKRCAHNPALKPKIVRNFSAQVPLDPRADELAAGRRPEKKCGLAAGKIAASRQPGQTNAAKCPVKVGVTTRC